MKAEELFEKFFKSYNVNLQQELLEIGIHGLLLAYDNWLFDNDLIDREAVDNLE